MTNVNRCTLIFSIFYRYRYNRYDKITYSEYRFSWNGRRMRSRVYLIFLDFSLCYGISKNVQRSFINPIYTRVNASKNSFARRRDRSVTRREHTILRDQLIAYALSIDSLTHSSDTKSRLILLISHIYMLQTNILENWKFSAHDKYRSIFSIEIGNIN